MQIMGIEGLSETDIDYELQRGGKFVCYQFCISVIFMTFRRSSSVFFLRAGDNGILKGLPYTLLSLLLGWWGIPWGPIYTVGSLTKNFGGGRDVTYEIRGALNRAGNYEGAE